MWLAAKENLNANHEALNYLSPQLAESEVNFDTKFTFPGLISKIFLIPSFFFSSLMQQYPLNEAIVNSDLS